MAKIQDIINQVQAIIKCADNSTILPDIDKILRGHLEYHSNGAPTEDLYISVPLLRTLDIDINNLTSKYVFDGKSESDLKNLIIIGIAKCGYEDAKAYLKDLNDDDNHLKDRIKKEPNGTAQSEFYNDLQYNDKKRKEIEEYFEYYGRLLTNNESLIRGIKDGTSRK